MCMSLVAESEVPQLVLVECEDGEQERVRLAVHIEPRRTASSKVAEDMDVTGRCAALR